VLFYKRDLPLHSLLLNTFSFTEKEEGDKSDVENVSNLNLLKFNKTYLNDLSVHLPRSVKRFGTYSFPLNPQEKKFEEIFPFVSGRSINVCSHALVSSRSSTSSKRRTSDFSTSDTTSEKEKEGSSLSKHSIFLNMPTIELDFIFPSRPVLRKFDFQNFDILKEEEAHFPTVNEVKDASSQKQSSPSPTPVAPSNLKKDRVSEFHLYDIFVFNFNQIFAKYGIPYFAKKTNKEPNASGNIPDITVRYKNTKSVIFYVEIKRNINIDFAGNAAQAIVYAKNILEEDKRRQFSICFLMSPNEFAVFCSYRYKGEIMSSALKEKTSFEWNYTDPDFKILLGLFLTDFNWYGDLFIPHPSGIQRFANNTCLTSYSVSDFNSSSHHFVSMILFLLVLLYLNHMKKKLGRLLFQTPNNSWELYFGLNVNPCDYTQPSNLTEMPKDTWMNFFSAVINSIAKDPQPWTRFVDAICCCDRVQVSWPEEFKKEKVNNDYITPFIQFYGAKENIFDDKMFSIFPINALLAFKTPFDKSDTPPLLPSYYCSEISLGDIALLINSLNTAFSILDSPFFLFQFKEVLSTPIKFSFFLNKYMNWKSFFSNIDYFSSSHLSMSKMERGRFLGSGLSGEVVEYSCCGKSYAVKSFFVDCEVELRREIFAYLIIQGVFPTLNMVSFDLKQQMLVLFPVASHPYKGHGQPKKELFENLVDDLNKLGALKMVHRDIRPDNLVYILIKGSERLILIDWSSSVYENVESRFEGTVRYASKEVLMQLTAGKTEVLYKVEDDLCSLVKVFLGRVLSVDEVLLNCNEEDIPSLARHVLEIWDDVSKRYKGIDELFEVAKTKDYEKIKVFIKGFDLWPSFAVLFLINMFFIILLFIIR
jgi:hypothetical protein